MYTQLTQDDSLDHPIQIIPWVMNVKDNLVVKYKMPTVDWTVKWNVEWLEPTTMWSVIVPIHKRDDKMIYSNYRRITLLSIPCKVYTRILDGRVRSITESKVMEVQGGFRRKRRCVDQVFMIRQLSEKVLEKNGQIACVHLKKAYDNVCGEKL